MFFLFFLALALVSVNGQISPFTLPQTYGDNMVLQRAPYNATIWGFANTNSIVSTTIYGVTYQAQAQALVGFSNYRWTLILNPIESSNQSINIVLTETRSDGVSTLTIKNVLFGDVWLCSGQSNMQLSLTRASDSADEIANGSQYDQIRLLTVNINTKNKSPQNDIVANGLKHKWTAPTAAILGKGDWSSFSAVCWFYGKELYKELNVPVGLIVSAWTGTNIEQWIDYDSLTNCGHTVTSGSDMYLLWSMITPFTRTSIKGMLWYQGESNADSSKSVAYDCYLTALIDTYRGYWYHNTSGSTNPQFPIGLVQIANPDNNMTAVEYYPNVRWAQTGGYGYTPNPKRQNVFLATAADLSDDTAAAVDIIHPRDKKDVALRLLAGALNVAYGRSDVEYNAPHVGSICYRPQVSAQVTLKSDFPISLSVNHDSGFEVCCDDSACPTNSANGWSATTGLSVSGSQFTLSIPSTCSVVNEVRYMWRQKPCTFKNCSLYSASTSLPILPFVFEVEKQCSVPEWSQCGGIGYTGITLCDPTYGLVCQYQNDYFSQCVKSPLPANTVAEWGQCGGLYYTGYTQCDTGLVCTFQNNWYSQCLKPAAEN